MARLFNGTSNYIQIDAASAQVSWWNDVLGRTYSGWINAAAGQSNVGIYSEGASASNTPFWFLSLSQTNANKLRWNGLGTPTANTTATVADSTWHHIALVIYPIPTTGNWWGLYVDGVLDQSGTMTSTVTGATTNQAALGALRRTTTGNFFSGKIAHWANWNRALSGEEIRMLARGVHLPSVFEPQNYWPLTGPDANIAQSLGKKRNHGTLVGTTISADVPPLVGRPQPAIWHQRYARWVVPTVTLPFIHSASALYTPALVGQLAIPFISSATTLYTPTIASTLTVPFISSVSTLYTPTLVGQLAVPFIGSVTTLYTPTLAAAEVDVPFISSVTTLYTPTVVESAIAVPFIASVTVVYGPGVPHQVTSGELALAADDVTVAPITVTPGSLFLTGDDLRVSGPYAATSGVLSLDADGPSAAGPIVPTNSGVLLVRGDSPLVAGGAQPTTGRFVLAADAPTIYPVAAQSGKLVLAASGPVVQPAPTTPGRLILAASGPTVYPLTVDSGRLLLRADGPQIFHAGIVLEASGILRLRSDVPIITPLTEPPPPPPPPPPGTGLAVSTTA